MMTNAPASRYADKGLRAAEALFAEAHPRAVQYLDQAPILVMWGLPWAGYTNDGRSHASQVIAGRCSVGAPLPATIRQFGFSAPMRALHAHALRASEANLYRHLAGIRPEVMGKIIPAQVKAQRKWLGALSAWVQWVARRDVGTDPRPLFAWAAERFARNPVDQQQACNLADFQLSSAPFNTAWGISRAVEEMDKWHRQLTLDRVIRGLPVGSDDVVDFGDHPDRIDVQGMTFTALRTVRDLVEEGAAMRHCVASYAGMVISGTSHIVSVTDAAGKRVATLELTGPKRKPTHRIVQTRGPQNARVAYAALPAIAAYAANLRAPDADRPFTDQPITLEMFR